MMTPQRLRELYPDVSPHADAKVISKLDHHCKTFIAHSSMVILATSDGTHLDVSPKGDPAGFVKLHSDTALLIPDRPGNNRIDGLLNILQHPQVALLFLIPSVGETLRVNGRAEVSEDPTLLERCQINTRTPKTVLRVQTDEIFLHCGKAPLRSGLWSPQTWAETRPIASMYEIIRDHTKMTVASTSQSYAEERYRKTLY